GALEHAEATPPSSGARFQSRCIVCGLFAEARRSEADVREVSRPRAEQAPRAPPRRAEAYRAPGQGEALRASVACVGFVLLIRRVVRTGSSSGGRVSTS